MRKILFGVFILFSCITIIRFVGLIHMEIRSINNVSLGLTSPLSIGFIKINLLGFLFGIILEWNALKTIAKVNIKVNLLLVPALLCFGLGIIPNYYWGIWFSTNAFLGTIYALSINESHILLMVLSGVLFIRSFTSPQA